MINAIVDIVSRDNPLPPDPEDEALGELATRGSRLSIKRRFVWLDSPLTDVVRSSIVSKRLRKKRNIDFLLGESDVVVEIPDDDTSKQSKRMDEEATGQPPEPKEEPEDTIVPSEGVIGKEPKVEFQTSSTFSSPLGKDGVIVGSSSLPLTVS